MSPVNLNVEPGHTESWQQFVAEKAPFSVALDGYVIGEPQFDEHGPWVNFNHHENVDRLATAATCEQVLTAIRSGLFETYREDGLPKAEIFVNDCDQDVCLSAYLLTNAPMVESATNPLINALVSVEGKLDATAGAYPFHPDLQIMRKIAWIFEPYTMFRNSGEINQREAQKYEQVIEACSRRIHDYMLGRGDELSLDLHYEVIDQRLGYAVVKEIGDQARLGMYAAGINAFVSFQEIPEKQSWRVSLGRRSQFIPFPIERIYEVLNNADPAINTADPSNKWGGGNTTGGSPRSTGTKLTPDQVLELIDSTLQAKEL